MSVWYKQLVQRDCMALYHVPYLMRRDGIFYFRRVLPAIGEIKISLKTSNDTIAKRHCRYMTLAIERLIEECEAMGKELTQEVVKRFVRSEFERMMRWSNRLLKECESGEKEASEMVALAKADEDAAREALFNKDFSSVEGIAGKLLRRYDIKNANPSKDTDHQLFVGLLRAKLESSRIEREKLLGNYDAVTPKDALFNGCDVDTIAPVVDLFMKKQGFKEEKVYTVRNVIDKYIQLKSRGDWTSESTIDENIRLFRWFVSMGYGDIDAQDLTIDEVRNFREILLRLPKGFALAKKYRGMSLEEIAEKGEGQRLTSSTLQKYYGFFNTFLEWAEKQKYTPQGLIIRGGIKTKNKKQKAKNKWSDEALQTLFHSPLYSGRDIEQNWWRGIAGKQVVKDDFYWIPLVGIYSGMRLGEILQLRVDHFAIEQGILYFDLTDVKQIKTEAGYRKVPIHPRLVELGLLDFVSGDGNDLVFRNVPWGAKRISHNASGWYSDYFRNIGIKTQKTSFHSLRHNLIQALFSCGVQEVFVRSIVGHEKEGTTQTNYVDSEDIKELFEKISRVHFNFTLLHEPVSVSKMDSGTPSKTLGN